MTTTTPLHFCGKCSVLRTEVIGERPEGKCDNCNASNIEMVEGVFFEADAFNLIRAGRGEFQ